MRHLTVILCVAGVLCLAACDASGGGDDGDSRPVFTGSDEPVPQPLPTPPAPTPTPTPATDSDEEESSAESSGDGSGCDAIRNEIARLEERIAFIKDMIAVHRELISNPDVLQTPEGDRNYEDWLLEQLREKGHRNARVGGSVQIVDCGAGADITVIEGDTPFETEVTQAHEEYHVENHVPRVECEDYEEEITEEEWRESVRELAREEIEAYQQVNLKMYEERLANLERDLEVCERVEDLPARGVSLSLYWDVSSAVSRAGEGYAHTHTFTLSGPDGTIATWVGQTYSPGNRGYYAYNGFETFSVTKAELLELTHAELVSLAMIEAGLTAPPR